MESPRRFGHNHSGARSSLCGGVITGGEESFYLPRISIMSPSSGESTPSAASAASNLSTPRQLYSSPSRRLGRVVSRPRTSLSGAVVSTDNGRNAGGKRTVGDERVRSSVPFGADTPFGQDRPQWPGRPAGPTAPHVAQQNNAPGLRCNGNVRTKSNVLFG